MPYLTGRRPAQELAIQLRMVAAFERSMQASVQREMSRLLKAAADTVEAGGMIQSVVDDHARNLTSIYTAAVEGVMPAFGDRILGAAGKAWKRHLVIKDSRGEFERAVERYLQQAGARAVIAAETTQEKLAAIIAAGRDDGMGQAEIARQITSGAPDLPGIGAFTPRVRAAVIARTEVHTASTVASRAAADSLGVVERYEWIAAEDTRTRPDHSAADGQTITRGERYDVGGSKLEHPGDPAGPARQVISCRCVEGFIT